VDYKSGSTPYSRRTVERGLAFQSALYALALERLLPGPVAASYYLHIPSRKKGGALAFEGRVAEEPQVRAAVQLATVFVERVRRGVFPSAPGAPEGDICGHRCDLAGLCRATRATRQAAERAGLA
jgi:hypothetical protein